jgi:hypothetical protein
MVNNILKWNEFSTAECEIIGCSSSSSGKDMDMKRIPGKGKVRSMLRTS